MPTPRRLSNKAAADALATVAPLASRWIERLLAGHDPPLTVAQFLALRAIAEEGVSGSELARRTGVSGPAVSQLIGGLADSGLLAREEFVEDRRRHTLTLTDRGQGALRSAQGLLSAQLASLLADLPHPEADALARALPQVAATLSGAPPPRRPPPPPPPGPPHRKTRRPAGP
jgi:DNA-binding MarR family transcriptional regulator